LVPHFNHFKGSPYLFPASGEDLDVGEFWYVNGCIHGMGKLGSQGFGYDMGVWGIDHEKGTYGWLKPEKKGITIDGSENRHFRIWKKQIYTMADGIVLESLNDCPRNPIPLDPNDPQFQEKMKDQEVNLWGTLTNGGSGNHFYIQHGNEVVLYAHMDTGTLNSKLLKTSSNPHPVVKAGELLGLAGNTGNSNAPHLHIHAIQGSLPEEETGPLRPIILRDAWAIDNDLIMGKPVYGLWSRIKNQGIPEGNPTTGYG
jgi:hypothetical protein